MNHPRRPLSHTHTALSPALCVLIAASLICATARAANTPESPYLADMPIVLSASRMPQPLNEAPGAISVVSGDFIRATGYRDLARIFRLVPGMQVGQERGNNYWVTYHGLGSTFPSELQILIDGRSIYSASAFGGVDWGALPVNIDEIDRIEIVRGPNAVSYGANAFMGVINIITQHTVQSSGSQVRTHLGSASIRDADAMSSQRLGPVNFRVTASTRNDSGFDNLNDDRHTDVLATRMDWRITDADELTLRLNSTSTRKGEGYEQSIFNSNGQRKSAGNTQAIHLNWTHAANATEEYLLHYYYMRERAIDAWNAIIPAGYPLGPTQVPINRSRHSVRNHLEFQYRALKTDRQTVLGAEIRRDEIEAAYLFSQGNPPPVGMVRAFANLDERLSQRWQLNIGSALEGYRGEDIHLAPRAFLNMHVDKAHTLRVGASRAWQQRPTFEKNVDVRVIDPISNTLLVHAYQPNPNLKQSRIDSAELGYLGRFQELRTHVDVRLFNERIKDYVVRVAKTSPAALTSYIGSSQYINYPSVITLRGVEYQITTQTGHGSKLQFNHTLIDRRSKDTNIKARIAPYTASLSWLQQWGMGWSSALSAVRMGPLSGGDGFVPVSSYVAKAYTSFDARLAWRKPLSEGRELEISLNAINLGKRHQEIPDRAEQGYLAALGNNDPANYANRMIYIGLGLQF